MYIGYIFFYFTRNSFNTAKIGLGDAFGFSLGELGLLTTVISISYGISKFVSGIISDRSNPRYFMAIGLIVTGVLNVFFGISSSFILFLSIWALNGWFQGWGWPPCAKLLTHWYSHSERGRWWGLWNSAHNIGAILIPLICGFVVTMWGWRWGMHLPGILSILIGLFLINRLRSTPDAMGLPPIEEYNGEEGGAEPSRKYSTKELLFEHVLKNKYVWVLGVAYFFVYIMRTAINDWGQYYLVKAQGQSLVLSAVVGPVLFEVGGMLGSFSAGYLSDNVFGGRRVPANALFCIGIILPFLGLWFIPAPSVVTLGALMFSTGFFVFGPQMLIGMTVAELCPKQAAGTATGFVGFLAYLGAAVAGGPIGKVADVWGWTGFFAVITFAAFIATSLLVPLWNIRKRSDTVEANS